jgi:endoglucanase
MESMNSLKNMFAVIGFGLIAVLASAQAAPPNWPWRGANIESMAYGTPANINNLASLKVNAVSLTFAVRTVAKFQNMTPDQAWSKYIAWADQMLDECKKHGMVAILTFNQMPSDPALGITQDSPQFWNNPKLLREAVYRAGLLAGHFNGRGDELGGYDMLNEPLETGVGVPTQWPALRDAMIKEIRKYDKSHYIVVTPGPGGEPSGYKDFKPVNDPRIVYSFHMYDPHIFTHQGVASYAMGVSYPSAASPELSKAGLARAMQAVVDFRRKNNAYVYVGEFSAVRWANGASQYLTDLIDLLDSDGFAWTYYSLGGYHAWNPSYDDQPSSDQPNELKQHYLGENTPRWQILKQAFAKNPVQ